MPANRVDIVQNFPFSVDKLYSYLSDHENLGLILPAKIRRIKDGKAGVNGVGSVRKLTLPGGVSLEETVTKAEKNKLIEYTITRGGFPVKNHLGGHGLSSGKPSEIDDFSHYQEVLRDLIAVLSPQLPKPWVAVGQSTGGGILFDHILSSLANGQRPYFARVQLWAPLVRITKWRQVTTAYTLLGRFKRSVPRHFKHSSHDPEFIDLIWHKDPFQLREVPLKWVGAMIRWDKHLQSLPACRYPISLVQGEADDTVDWRYNLGFIEKRTYVERAIMVPGAGHHLANESDEYRQPVLSALVRHVLI